MDLSTTFKELGLIAPLLQQLEKLNYKSPSPIQASCIPLLLQQKDVMGLAQTGTGKTAAFALPLIQHLIENPAKVKPNHVRSLILSPTRELARQIHDNIVSYGKHLKLSTSVVFGGVGYGHQKKALSRGIDILVATPGRLIDLMAQKAVRLHAVETLVMDEADRMLDMGFLPAIKKIVAEVPSKRHTQLFSATMPDSISRLAKGLLSNPETVMITPPTKTADKVEQWLCHVSGQDAKRDVLLSFLEDQKDKGLTLLFTRTKHGANRLASYLNGKGHPSAAIHGGKGQGTRDRLMKEFRNGTTRILVATDVAARGIDVKDIDLVINYDLPMEPEVYIHRIGRTARAEATGSSISFCSHDEIKYAKAIQKLLGMAIPLHETSQQAPASMKARMERPSETPRKRDNRDRQRPRRRNSRTASSRQRSSQRAASSAANAYMAARA